MSTNILPNPPDDSQEEIPHGRFTRDGAGRAIWQVRIPSATQAGVTYIVTHVRIDANSWTCTCPAFRFRAHCRHTKEAQKLYDEVVLSLYSCWDFKPFRRIRGRSRDGCFSGSYVDSSEHGTDRYTYHGAR